MGPTSAVKHILKGGKEHEKFITWVDKVANFALSLKSGMWGKKIPIIFRPFHEHTGKWFWWGDGNCTADEYKALWRMTVDRLRARGVDNFIYAYSPDNFKSKEHYLDFYPGHDYVDILGHDIEAAWLVLEAAEVVNYRVEEARKIAVEIAHAVSKGLDTEGGLDYEAHRKERHWWVQAEAMVGFLNAYEISKEAHFLEKSLICWDFIKKHFIDHENGEWFWGYTEGGELMRTEDKVGFWKCPYHNARACMEVRQRLRK